MLSKVADIYEEQVDNAVDGLTSLLEPIIMVVLGIVVGSLIIAMYLPIFKLGSVIGWLSIINISSKYGKIIIKEVC